MSPAIEGPRLVHPDEFREAMALTEQCFGYEHGGLEARMPHCFDESQPERHAIIKHDDDIVSHVACVPAELCAGDVSVECHGIAGVATDPEHRGSGYMTELIEFWLDRLRSREIPLAELEGDRMGYGRFGWENAGRELRFEITERSFGEPTTTGKVRPRQEGDLGLIAEIHERERYRITRDRRRYERLFDQQNLETLVYGGDRPAYLSYRGSEPASVLEFGGSNRGMRALLGTVLDEETEIELFTHPHHPQVPLFRDRSIGWQTRPHRKLNLLDLVGTLEAYEPLFSERWAAVIGEFGPVSGEVTLRIEGTAGSTATVTIAYDGSGVRVEQVGRNPDISLDRRTMTRLLFDSPDGWCRGKRSHPFLRAVLPLEYYFWRTETI